MEKVTRWKGSLESIINVGSTHTFKDAGRTCMFPQTHADPLVRLFMGHSNIINMTSVCKSF